MSEQPTEPLPPPMSLERLPKRKESPWPLLIGLAFLVLLIAGGVWLFLSKKSHEQPWRIQYDGITWIRGEDANTAEGQRYLRAEVRFQKRVVSAAEFQTFLGVLVEKTKGTYVYYHIRASNERGQQLIDGVADQSGNFSLTPLPDYENQ